MRCTVVTISKQPPAASSAPSPAPQASSRTGSVTKPPARASWCDNSKLQPRKSAGGAAMSSAATRRRRGKRQTAQLPPLALTQPSRSGAVSPHATSSGPAQFHLFHVKCLIASSLPFRHQHSGSQRTVRHLLQAALLNKCPEGLNTPHTAVEKMACHQAIAVLPCTCSSQYKNRRAYPRAGAGRQAEEAAAQVVLSQRGYPAGPVAQPFRATRVRAFRSTVAARHASMAHVCAGACSRSPFAHAARCVSRPGRGRCSLARGLRMRRRVGARICCGEQPRSRKRGRRRLQRQQRRVQEQGEGGAAAAGRARRGQDCVQVAGAQQRCAPGRQPCSKEMLKQPKPLVNAWMLLSCHGHDQQARVLSWCRQRCSKSQGFWSMHG